jgi:hypothetical protein
MKDHTSEAPTEEVERKKSNFFHSFWQASPEATLSEIYSRFYFFNYRLTKNLACINLPKIKSL